MQTTMMNLLTDLGKVSYCHHCMPSLFLFVTIVSGSTQGKASIMGVGWVGRFGMKLLQNANHKGQCSLKRPVACSTENRYRKYQHFISVLD